MRDGDFSHLFIFQPATAEMARLTNGSWNDNFPSISPDGTRLAFSSDRTGFWDLYVMDLSDQTVTNLTDNSQYDSAPSWSPDGKWLVFESYLENNLEILIIPTMPDGNPPIQLTKDPATDHTPVWAPHGRSILFVSNRTGDEEIWLANLDSTDHRFVNMSLQPATQDRDPDWSPDGEKMIWSSESNGTAYLTQMDLNENRKSNIAIGSLPKYCPDGKTILTLNENPNDRSIASYTINTGSLITVPEILAGEIYGMTLGFSTSLTEIFQTGQNTNQKPLLDESASNGMNSSNPMEKENLIALEGINAPYAFLQATAYDPFFALKRQVEIEVGWNFLDDLENAFLPLTEPPSPDMQQSWLYTGRAIAVNPMPLYGGWMAVVREDRSGQTYWRVFLKTRFQDGSQGTPLKLPVWNFNARYSGDPQSYEQGGKINGVPEGYWIDFTELALRYGWKRQPALQNWRTYFIGAFFNLFVHNGDLDWHNAMQDLYPEEALATATRIPTRTQTPTITSTATFTPRPSATLLPSRTSTPQATSTSTP